MAKSIQAAALAALVFVCGTARAADYLPPAPPMLRPYWQGPYIGANLGYQWGDVTHDGSNPSGVLGGFQAGYSWQAGPFVFGGEADVQASGASDRFAAWKFSNPWFGTARARAGLTTGSTLFYGTVGLAYGMLRKQNMPAGVSETHTDIGWAAGIGTEFALIANWTAKVEYLYVDLDNNAYALGATSHGFNTNVLRVGVNFRF